MTESAHPNGRKGRRAPGPRFLKEAEATRRYGGVGLRWSRTVIAMNWRDSPLRQPLPARDAKTELARLDQQHRELDCELLAKDVEIAQVDYELDAAVLEATRTLASGNVRSKFDLVLEEYDLSQSQARVEGFRRRARACKRRLEE